MSTPPEEGCHITSIEASNIGKVRVAEAIEGLKGRITGQYPTAFFHVSEGEDPEGVYLTAIVNIDDPDDVTDLVIDQMLRLQIEEQLPIYVVPIRPLHSIDNEPQSPTSSGVPLPSPP